MVVESVGEMKESGFHLEERVEVGNQSLSLTWT